MSEKFYRYQKACEVRVIADEVDSGFYSNPFCLHHCSFLVFSLVRSTGSGTAVNSSIGFSRNETMNSFGIHIYYLMVALSSFIIDEFLYSAVEVTQCSSCHVRYSRN